MATISVYDSDSGATKNVTIDIGQATVSGEGTGSAQFYVSVSTSERTPAGDTIAPIIITTFADDLTTEIKAAVVTLFGYMLDSQSSSSSESTASESSASPALSSLSSMSSSSASSDTSISSLSGV